MDSSPYPHCCGINIIGSFGYNQSYDKIDAAKLKEVETGAKAQCSHGSLCYLTAHIALVSDQQADAMKALLANGYRHLGRVMSKESRCYLNLLGKGFEAKS